MNLPAEIYMLSLVDLIGIAHWVIELSAVCISKLCLPDPWIGFNSFGSYAVLNSIKK